MAVGIVIVIVNVRAVRALFLLHVTVERAAANHVQELRPAADAQNRDFAAQGVAQQSNLDFVLERMRLFEIFVSWPLRALKRFGSTSSPSTSSRPSMCSMYCGRHAGVPVDDGHN